jgi:hypothetical protein
VELKLEDLLMPCSGKSWGLDRGITRLVQTWEMCAGRDEAERRWLVARRTGRCSFDDLARTHAWLCMFQMRVAEDVAFECVLKRFRSSGDFEGGELIWSAESTNAQADVAGRDDPL